MTKKLNFNDLQRALSRQKGISLNQMFSRRNCVGQSWNGSWIEFTYLIPIADKINTTLTNKLNQE